MQARSRNRSSISDAQKLDHRFDQVILWLTLGALFLIPLLFSYFDFVAVFNEPKIVVLHLSAGLISVLWLWQIVLRRMNARTQPHSDVNWDLAAWAGRNPARWAIIAAAIWVFAQLASTLLSPLPVISFYGGDEARSGYNLYDSLSLTVLFASVIFRFRTVRSLELLGYTLVATGVIAAVYGIAQHFGWDPIGGNENRTRVIASFGNTLNFGGYMVMSIPATLALTYKRVDRKWWWLAAVVLAVGVQVAGIWFSGGRGPFTAVAFSIVSFFAISIALGSTKELLRSAAVFVAASVVAAVIVALPSPTGDIGLSRALSIADQISSGGESAAATTDIKGGLTGRFAIWRASLDIATGWNVPVDEPTVNRLLRPLFGIGQDMYVYSFPAVGPAQSGLALVDHAHNYLIQLLVEQGYVGLLGFVALAGLAALATLAIIRRYRATGRGIDPLGLLMIMFLSANIGKMVELQSGVARVSDLAMTLAVLGAVIAIYEIGNRRLNGDSEQEDASTKTATKATASNQTVLGSTLLAAVVVTAVVMVLFFSWDIRRLSASMTLAAGHNDSDLNRRAQVWADAQAAAPERETITFNLFESYLNTAKQQRALGNDEEALRLLSVGREMLLEYERRDPFELDTQIGLSKTTSTYAEWGFNEYWQELTDRTIKIAETHAAYPTLLGTAATAMTSVGLHERAIKYADQAIATEATTKPWAKAWYAKGRSLYELGREEEAIATLKTATEKEPGTEGALLAHQVLAQVYKANGDMELYEHHTELGQGDITVQE